MRYVTVSQMKEIDRQATKEFGIPALDLMENAGRTVADEAVKITGNCEAAVFCGFGNNGGDGLVAARYLLNKGCKIRVFIIGKPRSFSTETNTNLELLLSLGATPSFISKEEDIELIFADVKTGLIVDAVFGIGLSGQVDGLYKKLFERINRSGVPVVSVDVPSGLDADTGKPLGEAVRANITVTFGCAKTGFKNKEALDYIGRLVVADIGFPAELTSQEIKTVGGKIKTIKLRGGRKGKLRRGHPWIFKGQFLKPALSVRPGDIVTLMDPDGKFIGRGYYNPRSDISIRLLTFNDEQIDERFFDNAFKTAIEKRKGTLARTNAYRAIFSESDRLPGLIVDVYGDTVVFQILTLGMEMLKSLAIAAIKDVLRPAYIYEKSVSPFRALEGPKDTCGWMGSEGKTVIEVTEGKARFLVDIANGHKTGFYLDQRRSRLAMDGISKGKRVLDLFCYTGGFAISAAVAGASHVVAIDAKQEALDIGCRSAELNGVQDKIKFIKADAFDFLEEALKNGETFDIIIVDPPSFLKTRKSIKMASKGYEELNTLAMKLVGEGGILATFSCSHNMPGGIFSAILKKSAAEAGKKFTIMKRCRQDIDHPIVRQVPETEYLKGYFLKIESRD